MASKHIKPLSRAELAFWQAAFLKAELAVLLKTRRVSPEIAAHLCADFANASVTEFRNIRKGASR